MSASDEAAVGQVTVSADGSDWRDISAPVQSIDVEDHEHLTDKATIVLDDQTGVLAHAALQGLEARVTLGWNAEKTTIFEGEITAARAVTTQEGQKLELTALDFSCRMARHTPAGEDPVQWNTGQKLSDVVKSIVERPGYDVKAFQVEPTEDVSFGETNPLRQTNVDDWQFLQILAERYNCRSFIEFDGTNRSNFYFMPIARLASAEPVGFLRCCRGLGELISFDYERVATGSITELEATATDPSSGETTTQQSPPSPGPAPVPAPEPQRDPDLSAGRRRAIEALTELSATASARVAQARARVRSESADPAAASARIVPDPTRALGLRGTGSATGTVLLRAKSRVNISGVAPWAEGAWYVTKVNHVFRRQLVGPSMQRHTSYVSNFQVTR